MSGGVTTSDNAGQGGGRGGSENPSMAPLYTSLNFAITYSFNSHCTSFHIHPQVTNPYMYLRNI